MLEFTLSGNDFFDGVSQPVLLVQAQTIQYFNPAAGSLFALAGISLSVGAPAPEQLPEPGSSAATMTLAGRHWSVLIRATKSGTLYQFTPIREQSEEESARLRQLSIQLQVMVSHAGIAAEALQRELSETEQHRSSRQIARLNRSLHRLLRMSGHLDFCSRSDSELLILFPAETVELAGFCRELEQTIHPVARQVNHSLVFDGFSKELLGLVNSEMLRQVLYNLISNALKAGGDMRLRLRRRGSSAILTLTDTGKGISPDKMETLFSFDGEDSTGNLSLGLPLCRRILQLYGGQLVVSSSRSGTSVSISLPLCTNQKRLRQTLPVLPEQGYSLLLIELSDVLPDALYGQEDVL